MRGLVEWLIYERGWDPEEMMEKVVFCKLMLKYLRTATVTGQLPIDRATDTTVDALLLSLNGIGRLSMIPKTRWWSLRRHPTNDRRGMGFLRIVHFIRRSLCPWLYRLCIPMMAAGVSIINFSLAACDSSAALQSIIKPVSNGMTDWWKNGLLAGFLQKHTHSLDHTTATYLDSDSHFDRGNHCN